MSALALQALNQMAPTGCMGDGTGLVILAGIGVALLLAFVAGLVFFLGIDTEKRRTVRWVLAALGFTVADGLLAMVLAEVLSVFGPVVAAVPSVVLLVWASKRAKARRDRERVLPDDAKVLRSPEE